MQDRRRAGKRRSGPRTAPTTATLAFALLLLPWWPAAAIGEEKAPAGAAGAAATTGATPPTGVPTPASQEASTEDLTRAIDAMRGIDLAGLSREQKDELAERISATWDLILGNRTKAGPVLKKALDQELTDHFFTIDGAHLYLLIEEGSPEALDSAARWLGRVDPNAHPSRFFAIVAPMASLRCEACRPAILKMLQLDNLGGYIESTGLRADLERGLLLTLVSDNEALMPDLVKALASDNCVVRSNAAWAIGMILPPEVPERLRVMAEKDDCRRARVRAWNALADLDPGYLLEILAPRTESPASFPAEETAEMVDAIAAVYRPVMVPLLERLSTHRDPVVAAKATQTLGDFRAAWPDFERHLGEMGADTDGQRTRIRERLEGAIASARFVFDGTIFDITKALAPEDLDLVDRARFSVLRRLSGDCLGEYRTLLGASSMMRQPLSTRKEAAAAGNTEGAR